MGGGGVGREGSTCGDDLAGRTGSVVCPAGACTGVAADIGAAVGTGFCGIGVADDALFGAFGGTIGIVGWAFGGIISG